MPAEICPLTLGRAHAARFVGYLEEEAVKTYTDILAAVDDGAGPNVWDPCLSVCQCVCACARAWFV